MIQPLIDIDNIEWERLRWRDVLLIRTTLGLTVEELSQRLGVGMRAFYNWRASGVPRWATRSLRYIAELENRRIPIESVECVEITWRDLCELRLEMRLTETEFADLLGYELQGYWAWNRRTIPRWVMHTVAYMDRLYSKAPRAVQRLITPGIPHRGQIYENKALRETTAA